MTQETFCYKRGQKIKNYGGPGGVIELKESAEEASIREVKEETGFTIHIEYLIGIYTKYFMTFPGGDESQTICHFFKGAIIGGERSIDHEEIFDVQFFHPQYVPSLFCQIHQDMMHDYLHKGTGVYR